MRLSSATTSRTGLLSLVLLYLFLMAIVLIFSSQILSDLSFSRTRTGTLIAMLGAGFTIFLVISIVVNVIQLTRSIKLRASGSLFRFRLVLFFLVIVVVSAVPQAILSINVINTALNSWFDAKVGSSLRSGLSFAIGYYNDKVDNLQTFNDSQFYIRLLREVDRNPSRVWNNIQVLNPEIDSFQVLLEEQSTFFFAGDEDTRIIDILGQSQKDDLVTKDTIEDLSILRIRKSFSIENIQYVAVLSVVLPQGFDLMAQELTRSIELFSQLDIYRPVFMLGIVIFISFFSIPLLLLAILTSFSLSDEIIKPIVHLEEATMKIAEGDYSFRILTNPREELSFLSRSFNRMISELDKNRRKLVQTEKVAAWQDIARQLAHEIKNPLTPIKLSAQRIERKFKQDAPDFPEVLEKSVGAIIREVDLLSKMLSEFREFAKLPAPNLMSVSLSILVAEVIAMYKQTAADISIRYTDESENMLILGDYGQLKQVFANLIKNAIESMEAGTVFIRVDTLQKSRQPFCRVSIKDSGKGISEESKGQIFNPYFTTKKDGTGLGLAIAERIILDHNGQIWFESKVGSGTTFFVDLPAGEDPQHIQHGEVNG